MFYLPILYYPTKREDRATGFLIPTYGSSTLRGQSIHNAFFWAINRSQDATFLHDWYSKTGQGVGGEYRYNFGGGATATSRGTCSNEHEATYAARRQAACRRASAATRSAAAPTRCCPAICARARASTTSRASRRHADVQHQHLRRLAQPALASAATSSAPGGRFSLNGTLDHSEYFYDARPTRASSGSSPRVALTRNERPLFGTRRSTSRSAPSSRTSTAQTEERRRGHRRQRASAAFDFAPQIRYPFKKWQWFTVNSSVELARHLLHAQPRSIR